MRLHLENMENKFEGVNRLKKENIYLIEKIKKMEDTKKDNEIFILKCENKNIKELLGKIEKEFENKEKDFNEKINNLNKRLLHHEETGKHQNSRIMIDSEVDKSVNIINLIKIH